MRYYTVGEDGRTRLPLEAPEKCRREHDWVYRGSSGTRSPCDDCRDFTYPPEHALPWIWVARYLNCPFDEVSPLTLGDVMWIMENANEISG